MVVLYLFQKAQRQVLLFSTHHSRRVHLPYTHPPAPQQTATRTAFSAIWQCILGAHACRLYEQYIVIMYVRHVRIPLSSMIGQTHSQNNQLGGRAPAAAQPPPAAQNDDDDLEQQVRDNVAFLPPRHSFPTMGELLCPRFNPCSFIFFACVVELAAFVATLAVGAAKFDGAFVVGNAMGGPSSETFLYMGAKWCVDFAISPFSFARLVYPPYLARTPCLVLN